MVVCFWVQMEPYCFFIFYRDYICEYYLQYFDNAFTMCSQILSCKLLPVFPTYWRSHFHRLLNKLHPLLYSWNPLLTRTFLLCFVDLKSFFSLIWMSFGHFLHCFIPGMILFGPNLLSLGSFVLQRRAMMLGGCLEVWETFQASFCLWSKFSSVLPEC